MHRALCVACALLTWSSTAWAQPWMPDRGDGRYRNPVLFADYSDPDVVRVDDDYYMTASSFNSVPGLPILHSRDLVNWRIVAHAIQRMPPDFDVPQHGNGVWAPSIRYHLGEYYIYWGDPDRGIYVVKTRNPRGRWNEPVLVRAAKGWIDPAPLWDDDGNAWLVHAFARSRSGIKHVLHVNRMSTDGLRLLDEGTPVFMDSVRHPTMEGPKLYKRGGWYYIFAPAGGVATGWQTVLRSRNVLGPYEDRIVLAQGTTSINGPHQGAWVTTTRGEDWFVHFQDRGPYGRVVHLQPMTWKDDWPHIGADPDGDGTGEPVLEHRKPRVRTRVPVPIAPLVSDEFDTRSLALQWQWHANEQPGWFSLAARRGSLRLFTQAPSDTSGNLWTAGNLLLQKLPAPAFTVFTRVTLHDTTPGAAAGLLMMGLDYAWIGVRRSANGYDIVHATTRNAHQGTSEQLTTAAHVPTGSTLLRMTVANPAGDTALVSFSWSKDGVRWTRIGEPFQAREGRWIGAKMGLFARRPKHAPPGGFADVDYFRVR